MTLTSYFQTIQFIAWLVALTELVLGLYALVLNAREAANRNASIFLVSAAVSTFTIGWMIAAEGSIQAFSPALVSAIVSPTIPLLFFLAALAIVVPDWTQGKLRSLWLVTYLLALIPAGVTLVDINTGSHYWFTGIPSGYTSGLVPFTEYTSGSLAAFIHASAFIGIPLLTSLFLGYFAIVNRQIAPNNRRLAWILLLAIVASTAINLLLSPLLIQEAAEVLPISILALLTGIAAFQQMISERRSQRGSLQARLSAMILVITIPLLLAVSLYITWRTGAWSNEGSRQEIFILIAVCIVLQLSLSWLSIRQAVQPVGDLTKTATGIASGDLTLVARVQSNDEIGVLARAFNSMTTQLRETITNLERRVAERTRDMERRAVQLQIAAEVSSQAAAIRDLNQLMDDSVRLISERFNFYHAGIFLLDERQKFAVLRAASSEGGQKMLARGHKLGVGQLGVVGYVAGKGEPRIVLDVGEDAVYFNNPELPQTRSEMALPLKIRDRITGVLDVQSTKAAAFTDDDIEILQILADQIALAIENAKLISENQTVIQQLDGLYQMQIGQSWKRRLQSTNIAYSYRQGNLKKELAQVHLDDHLNSDPYTLRLPIEMRDQTLGWITLRRNPEAQPWSRDETEFTQEIIAQLALSLENARLLDENRKRAQNEEYLAHISSRTTGLLDVETVIKTAVQEIGSSFDLARVQIKLGGDQLPPQPPPDTGELSRLIW